jgi:hypothetical protein
LCHDTMHCTLRSRSYKKIMVVIQRRALETAAVVPVVYHAAPLVTIHYVKSIWKFPPLMANMILLHMWLGVRSWNFFSCHDIAASSQVKAAISEFTNFALIWWCEYKNKHPTDIEVDSNKIDAIWEWPTLTTVTQIRSVLGLAAFYCRFVYDFSTIAAPLHELTKKDVPFSWSDSLEVAFNTLKDS